MKLLTLLSVATAALFTSAFAADEARDNSIPNGVSKALDTAKSIILYSIDPAPSGDSSTEMHGHKILGSTTLTGDACAKVIAEFRTAVKNFDGTSARCFNPRHAIRITNGGVTYDVLICFECDVFHTFEGAKASAAGGLTGKGSVMNEFLKAAAIPLAPASKN